jgi:hypothetical protein
LVRLLAIHTADATIAAAIIPKIPYIHGSKPADWVTGLDCAGLLAGCPAPVVVPPDPGLYPPPGLEFGPELEPGPGPAPDPDPGPDPEPGPEELPEFDPTVESELPVCINRWLRSRVVLVSFNEAWTSIPNSLMIGIGVSGQTINVGLVVVDELHGAGGMNSSSPNPRWMSAFAARRRSLVWS